MLPERKAPADSQRILEEDVPDSGKVQPRPDESQPPSNLESPGGPPAETLPPGSRPPRRLKFRDRGMDRGWDFPGKNEPFVA
jgi:hypothetical protein